MTETKLRQFVKKHEFEIAGGLIGVGIACGYLITVNLASREAAKTAARVIKRHPISVTTEIDTESLTKAIIEHMTVDENAIAARILQGIVDVQRGAEVMLDARPV